MNADDRLLAILRIGHDTSMRGEGLSLRQALSRAQYLKERPQFTSRDLLRLIRERRDFIDQWIEYSADKRTSSGWYVTEGGVVGQVDDPNSMMHFASIEEVVAEYVVRELDYWAAL